MTRDPSLERIARAGFDAFEVELEYRARQKGGHRPARTWERATENDRIWWRYVVDTGAVTPEEVFTARMDGAYGVTPWAEKNERERLVWERIANAMDEARGRMSASIAAD